jgi:hypothetical protein
MSTHRPLLLAVAVSCALLSIVTAIQKKKTSSPFDDVCNCPKPDQCDNHACPGGCFYNLTLRQCIPAYAGFYAQLTNASESNVDTPCPCGAFSPSRGSVACTVCPVGQYTSGSASVSCDVCPAGTDCPFTGMCSAYPCALGTYSSTVGSSSAQLLLAFVGWRCSHRFILCLQNACHALRVFAAHT